MEPTSIAPRRYEILHAPDRSPPYCRFYVIDLTTGRYVAFLPTMQSAEGNYPGAVFRGAVATTTT